MATTNQKWGMGLAGLAAAVTVGYFLLRNPSKTEESVEGKPVNGVYLLMGKSEATPVQIAPASIEGKVEYFSGADGSVKLGLQVPIAIDQEELLRAHVGAPLPLANVPGGYFARAEDGKSYLMAKANPGSLTVQAPAPEKTGKKSN